MKKLLLLFIGILFSGFAFADGITVKVVNTLDDATGTDTYVYNKEDGKIYAYNTKGEYELYGEYSRVNTLKTAGGDLEIEYIENLALTQPSTAAATTLTKTHNTLSEPRYCPWKATRAIPQQSQSTLWPLRRTSCSSTSDS